MAEKTGFELEYFDKIMNTPPKSFLDYHSYYPLVKALQKPIKWGNTIGVVPDMVYKKYFSVSLQVSRISVDQRYLREMFFYADLTDLHRCLGMITTHYPANITKIDNQRNGLHL